MTIKEEYRATENLPARGAGAVAAGGSVLGAIAASSCCVLPLVLLSLGVSGAWIGNLTALAPYQPYLFAVTFGFLGYGYWLAFRRSQAACTSDQACAQPMPDRLIKFGLFVATILVVAAIAFNLLAPYLLLS